MIFEIKKALKSIKNPRLRSNFMGLLKNALPYYISPNIDVPAPKILSYAINDICNLKCKMCDIGQKNREGLFYKTIKQDEGNTKIDIDVFKKSIMEVVKYRPSIAINSTEPLLHPNIDEMVRFCVDNGLNISITTNGYLLEQYAAKLAAAKLPQINISVDGGGGNT